MTAQEYVAKLTKMALEAFAEHKLVGSDIAKCNRLGRWRIAQNYPDGVFCSNFATEIISLWGGRLFVGGDIDDCVFAYYSPNVKEDNPLFHRKKLQWIGLNDAPSSYVHEKARIGLTDNGKLTTTFEPDVALHEMREHVKDNEIEGADAVVFEEAEHRCDNETELNTFLYNHLDDTCDLPDFGMVMSPRVINAWAACHRLCELLQPQWNAEDDAYKNRPRHGKLA